MNLYGISVTSDEQIDVPDHVEISLDWDASDWTEEQQAAVGAREWHAARVAVAGVIARAVAILAPKVDQCAHEHGCAADGGWLSEDGWHRDGCGVSTWNLDDLDEFMACITVPLKQKSAWVKLIRATLAGCLKSMTPPAEEPPARPVRVLLARRNLGQAR